ncbi:MAG: hypothetical protein ABSF46_13680 [Terriglobia bacterium]
MSLSREMHVKSLRKKAKRGFRGYPVATIAYYGPDDKRASKVAVGILEEEDGAVTAMERWFADDGDVRADDSILQAILEFIKDRGVQSVVMADRIIGCPHEEGKDFPEGEKCPRCPFWAMRDRWSGEVIQ